MKLQDILIQKPDEKSDEMSIRSVINNLEISDESVKKKSIGEKGNKLMKNNIFNTNKITKINFILTTIKKNNLLFFNLNIY